MSRDRNLWVIPKMFSFNLVDLLGASICSQSGRNGGIGRKAARPGMILGRWAAVLAGLLLAVSVARLSAQEKPIPQGGVFDPNSGAGVSDVARQEKSLPQDEVLELPSRAIPLETILPVPENLLPEKAPSASAWQLLPVGPGPKEKSPSANRDAGSGVGDQQPVPVQWVVGVTPDGQSDETRAQLAVQIVPPPSASPGENSPRQPAPEEKVLPGALRYRLQKAPAAAPEAFQWKQLGPASLGLWEGKMPVLVYNHGPITNPSVPAKDHRRTRACYVHPLYGLQGEVLTDDFPKDHYHHHGVFWAWPHMVIEGKEHDLWAGATIRQEFVRWLARQSGPVCAVLGVENGWYVAGKKVMVERIWFWVYRTVPGRHRSIDIALYLEPTDQPVTLWGAPEKSYGGLTVRFAPSARPQTQITVPTGRTTEDLLDTRLKWADFTSQMLGSSFRSGAAILIHPQHPDYPPTWLTRHYGAMCVGWPGVRPKTLHPGQPVRLPYRLWIHPGPVELEELTAAYEAFCAAAEQVRWMRP